MKNQIIIILFLLTTFCAAPIFAQLQESDLRSEFIRLNKFDLKPIENDFQTLDEQSKLLSELIKPLLSKRGSVEFYSGSNTIVITDTKNRLKLAVEFVKVLENSEFSGKELLKSVDGKEELVTETVKTQNMFPIVICYGFAHSGKNFDPPIWANDQSIMLMEINRKLKLVSGESEIRGEIKIRGTRKRVDLFKKLITLFYQPFLAEEFENQ